MGVYPMGAWGHGILQNDSAQDDLCEVIAGIYGDVIALGKEPTNRTTVARLGAGVGLMLQLSAGYWFSEEGHYWGPLREVLALHEKGFAAVPPEAGRILADVLAGKGEELAARDAPPDTRLSGALFAEESQGFPMERTFGYREPALFADPEAERYVQEVADRLARNVDEGIAYDDMVADPCREANFMAALVVLLVLEPCRVRPDRFTSWRARFRKVQGEAGPGDPNESAFFAAYHACLEQALQIGIDRFSAAS
jgi:hypothetical protein